MKTVPEAFVESYARMSDLQLASINREDLTEAARQYYDRQLEPRSVMRGSDKDYDESGDSATNATSPIDSSVAVVVAFILFLITGVFLVEHVSTPLGVLCWFAGAIFTVTLAHDGGCNLGFWFALALTFGPLATLLLLSLPPRSSLAARIAIGILRLVMQLISS